MWDKGNAFTKQTESFSLNVFISIFFIQTAKFQQVQNFKIRSTGRRHVFSVFHKVKNNERKGQNSIYHGHSKSGLFGKWAKCFSSQ